MGHSGYTTEEIASRGQDIYDHQIRPQVEAGNKGKVLILDIETGAYVIADDHLTAMKESHQLQPGAVLFSVKIGYLTMGRIGSRLQKGTP